VLARAHDLLIVSWMEPFSLALTAQVHDIGFLAFFLGVWILFFVSLTPCDGKTLRRIHPVTAAGFASFVLAWLMSAATGRTAKGLRTRWETSFRPA
jgi:hypothetical protein